MVPLVSIHAPKPSLLFTSTTNPLPLHAYLWRRQNPPRRTHFRAASTSGDPLRFDQSRKQQRIQANQDQPRTLFPGGYKRLEIKVPNLVLQLDSDEVLAGGEVLEAIDEAVSKWVGIVVLNGAQGSGGRLYEAACLLKSVVRDRAYLMVNERVDIAAAVNASGVVLSDQGIPAIVARNTMMDSKSGSLFLPLVARKVQTADAALYASNSEGADFLIYHSTEGECIDEGIETLFENVKLPIFIIFTFNGKQTSVSEASELLKSGASGLVITLEEFRLFSDDISKLFATVYSENKRNIDERKSFARFKLSDEDNGFQGQKGLEDREKQFIESERSILLEAVDLIKKAAPLMEEVSLLIDAISQLDEPFLLAIVGEFNSGKSTVINALLGRRYLKEGVVPTTNEITFLRYSNLDSDVHQQRCERHPDGQYICYLPSPILKEMNIVDTPGTNVILQRQQRLTEEFVPRADLLLFVISADRPLTESEVNFLRYIQQWKKKVVFVLNKADIYRDSLELEEAISFVKDNTKKLLNTEHVTVYPVSARSALEAKLEASSESDSHRKASSFYELENFLYGFLDGSTSAGMERIKLKLETPIGIAERLLSACETQVREECLNARQELASIGEIVYSVEAYTTKMENESLSWRRRTLSLIDTTKSNVLKLIESTLQLSNLDLAASYTFKGASSSKMQASLRVQNDVIGPALLEAQKLLGEYVTWLQSSNARKGGLYKDSLERKGSSLVYLDSQVNLETYELLRRADELSLKLLEDFSASAASMLFEQEVREVFFGTFGGLGIAGLSASLLTSVLPSTMEDLLALGLCSAGGYVAISNFPTRRRKMISKVNRAADALSRELDEAMQKDLSESLSNLKNFVELVSKPYQEAAQSRLDKLLEVQDELSRLEQKLRSMRSEIQNLHVS